MEESVRTMAHSGSFYPSKPSEIETMIHRFNHMLEAVPENVWRLDMYVTYAVIVPHAGWVYSGFTANMAYRVLGGSLIDTVVVIGPSHRVGFEGISISTAQTYQTPLGDIVIDQTLVGYLMDTYGLTHNPAAHYEHSTEVQMPFIRHYLPHASVVELVYGDADPQSLIPIIDYLLDHQKYGVVITTDLSHFYPLQEANEIDSICLSAIEHVNPYILSEGCQACGAAGVEAVLAVAQEKDYESVMLDYRTSADVSEDESSVVGYVSALFQEKLW